MKLLGNRIRLSFFKKNIPCIILLFWVGVPSLAQKNTVIPIETDQNALVLQMDKDNHPFIIYFGKKLRNANEYANIPAQVLQHDRNAGIYNSAYTPAGSWNLVEPAIRVTHGDGNTSLDLLYVN